MIISAELSPQRRSDPWALVALLVLLFLGVYLQQLIVVLLVIVLAIPLTLIRPVAGLTLYLVSATSGNFFALAVLPGLSLSRVFGLMFVAAAAMNMLRHRWRVNTALLAFAGIVSFLNLASLLYSMEPSGTLEAVLTMTLNILVVVAVSALPWGDELHAVRDMSLGAVSTLLYFGLVMAIRGVPDEGRLSLSVIVNPNNFGMAVAQLLCLPLWSVLVKHRNRQWPVAVQVLGLMVSVPMLFASGSRSSLFAVVVGGVFLIYLALRRLVSLRPLGVLFTSVAALLVGIFGGILAPDIANRLTLASVVATQGTRRFIIWEYLFTNVISNHLLLGTGLGGQTVVAALSQVPIIYRMPAHNLLLDLLTQVGVVGLVAYVWFFAWCLRRGIMAIRSQPLAVPFLLMFVVSLTIGVGETMIQEKLLWLAAGMCIRYSYVDLKREPFLSRT